MSAATHSDANSYAEDDRSRMSWAELEVIEQMEVMADEPGDSPEISKKKKMARSALTLWQESLKTLEDRRDRLQLAVSGAKNEIYQLVSLYSVFAGVVLTAVSTSSRLECQHLWSPVGLCLFAYLMIIVITHMKLQTISLLGKPYGGKT